MEVAAADRPDAEMGAAGVALGALKSREAVEALALEAVDLGPATPKLDGFKLAPADKCMGEKAAVAVAVAGDGIAAKENAGTFGCELAYGGGGVLGPALDRGARPNVLGGVDTDEPNVVEPAGGPTDAEGVAVDDVGDRGST